jgi:hypothetical protein
MSSAPTLCESTELGTPYSGGTIRNLSHRKGVYTPKGFFHHAASLGHAFAHCRRFSTAATRRCPGSISVLVLGVVLPHPLSVVALVGRYPTNKLIDRRPLPERHPCGCLSSSTFQRRSVRGIIPPFGELYLSLGYVTHVLRTRLPRLALRPNVRLACLIHAATVHPELGSNS